VVESATAVPYFAAARAAHAMPIASLATAGAGPFMSVGDFVGVAIQ